MYKITINIALIFCLLVSCSTVKNDKIGKVKSEENLVVEYCKSKSDKNFFRASATVKHPDLGESEYEAVQFAKLQMSENIAQTVKAYTERNTETRQIDGVTDYNKLIEGMTVFSSNVDLADVNTICTKVIYIKKNVDEFGTINPAVYQRFVAIEMSKDAVLKSIENKISKDDAMYQDYKKSELSKRMKENFAGGTE
tara:strand:- start:3236 stop:3823 length:588 start_codon:yes stop_codon:yes gene_type:complete